MDLDAAAVLNLLKKRRKHELRAWVRNLFSYGHSDPDCPWPGEDSAAARLRMLYLFETNDETLIDLQDRLVDAAVDLAGLYSVHKHGVACGLELLDFASMIHNKTAAAAFNMKIIDGALAAEEHNGRSLWVLSQHVSSKTLLWKDVKPWVRRDTDLSRRAPSAVTGQQRLRVALSAIGVWAREGPVRTYASLFDTIVTMLTHPEHERILPDLAAHFTSALERIHTREALRIIEPIYSPVSELWRELLASCEYSDADSLLAQLPDADPEILDLDRWNRGVEAVTRIVQKNAEAVP